MRWTSQGSLSLTRRLSAASMLALAAGFAATPALAQDEGDTIGQPGEEGDTVANADENDESIVVTGFRQSLTAAINAKREDTGIVDVIKAEDIAKFPDTNLAESLQRIPGVAITATPAKAARSPCAALAATSRACASTASRRWPPPAAPTARAAPTAAAASTSTSSRRSCSTRSRCARARRPKSTRARSARPSTCRPPRPFDYRRLRRGGLGARCGYNDLSRDWDRPAPGLPASPTLSRRPLGVLLSVAYTERPARGRIQHGALGQRRRRRRLVLAGGHGAAEPDGRRRQCGRHAQGVPRLAAPAQHADRRGRIQRGRARRQLPPAPAALRAADARAGPPRRHRVAPGAALDGTLVTVDMLYRNLGPRGRRTFSRRSRSAAPRRRAASRRPACCRPSMRPNGGAAVRQLQRRGHSLGAALRRTEHRVHAAHADDRARVHRPAEAGVAARPAEVAIPQPVQTTTTLDALNVNGYAIDFRGTTACRRSPIRSTSPAPPAAADARRHAAGRHAEPTSRRRRIRIRPQGANNRTTCPRRH